MCLLAFPRQPSNFRYRFKIEFQAGADGERETNIIPRAQKVFELRPN